jgi:hypothetical protein
MQRIFVKHIAHFCEISEKTKIKIASFLQQVQESSQIIERFLTFFTFISGLWPIFFKPQYTTFFPKFNKTYIVQNHSIHNLSNHITKIIRFFCNRLTKYEIILLKFFAKALSLCMLKPMGLIMVTILFKLDEGLDQML